MFGLLRKLLSPRRKSQAMLQPADAVETEQLSAKHQSGETQKSEHPRKAELRQISNDIGWTEQTCPYCKTPLPKFPQRKTKCPKCQKPIYPRKEPLSGQKRLFRDCELDTLDEIQQFKNDSWESWHSRRQNLLSAKEELAREWGKDPSEISDSDANWRLHVRAWGAALADGKWMGYRGAKVAAIRQLIDEGRLQDAAQMAPECIYLAYVDIVPAWFRQSWSLTGDSEWDNEYISNTQKIYGPELCLYISTFETIDRAKECFFADRQVSGLVASFGLSAEDAWKRFAEDWSAHQAAIGDR